MRTLGRRNFCFLLTRNPSHRHRISLRKSNLRALFATNRRTICLSVIYFINLVRLDAKMHQSFLFWSCCNSICLLVIFKGKLSLFLAFIFLLDFLLRIIFRNHETILVLIYLNSSLWLILNLGEI